MVLPVGADAVLSGSDRPRISTLASQEPFRECARIPRLQRLRIRSKRPRTSAEDRGSHPPADPAPSMNMQQRLARDFYETLPTCALKRATWVAAWRHASASSFPKNLRFSEQMQRGYLRFKTLSEEEKQTFVKRVRCGTNKNVIAIRIT